MLPRKIEHDVPEAERRRWQIVRLDTYQVVPGLILSANCDTGVCTLSVVTGSVTGEDGKKTATTEVRDLSFGPGGLAIIGR
jgi:hypothetical protein